MIDKNDKNEEEIGKKKSLPPSHHDLHHWTYKIKPDGWYLPVWSVEGYDGDLTTERNVPTTQQEGA